MKLPFSWLRIPSRNILCLLFSLFQSGAALQLPWTLMTLTLLQIPGQLFCRTGFEIVRFLHHQAVMGRGGADQTVTQRLGLCLGWLRRTSDQPHQPPYILPDLARPDPFCGCLPCRGFHTHLTEVFGFPVAPTLEPWSTLSSSTP